MMLFKDKLQQACLFLEQDPSSFWAMMEEPRHGVALLSGGVLPFLAKCVRQQEEMDQLKGLGQLWHVLNKDRLIETGKVDARDVIEAFLVEGFAHQDLGFVQRFCVFCKTYPFLPQSKQLDLLDQMILTQGSKGVGQHPSMVIDRMMGLFEMNLLNENRFRAFVHHIITKESATFLPALLNHPKCLSLNIESIIDIGGLVKISIQNQRDLLEPLFSPVYRDRPIYQKLQQQVVKHWEDSHQRLSGGTLPKNQQLGMIQLPNFAMLYGWLEKLDDHFYLKAMKGTPALLEEMLMHDTAGRKERLKTVLIDDYPQVLDCMEAYHAWVIHTQIKSEDAPSSKPKKM